MTEKHILDNQEANVTEAESHSQAQKAPLSYRQKYMAYLDARLQNVEQEPATYSFQDVLSHWLAVFFV